MSNQPRIPLLILSDHPNSPTGLGRITRDLALHIRGNLHTTFDLATLGIGGSYTRTLDFHQYAAHVAPDRSFVNFHQVWQDHSQGRPGIILTILNPGWLSWLTHPDQLSSDPSHLALKHFLFGQPRNFKLWAYVPVDGHNSLGQLPPPCGEALSRFDRILAYTSYGSNIIENSINQLRDPYDGPIPPIPHLPHGLHSQIFWPRHRQRARSTFIHRTTQTLPDPQKPTPPITPDHKLIGIVATNTSRKDWPLAFQAISQLVRRGHNCLMWCHTDAPIKHWNLLELAREYGLMKRLMITTAQLNDLDLAWAYSALDCTLAIGSGEGWGYPIIESLACQIPVVHGNYAGGAEITPFELLVDPIAWQTENSSNILRPIFDAKQWADKVELAMTQPSTINQFPKEIDWKVAWPKWREWMLEGLERGQE